MDTSLKPAEWANDLLTPVVIEAISGAKALGDALRMYRCGVPSCGGWFLGPYTYLKEGQLTWNVCRNHCGSHSLSHVHSKDNPECVETLERFNRRRPKNPTGIPWGRWE